MNSTHRSVDELWLHVLELVAGRAAHDIRGALNGVAVNLEVVRSRSAKADAPAASVASFATVAAAQLELVTNMVEAMLALARPPREPVEVGATVNRIAMLLRASARSEGFALDVIDAAADGVLAEVAGGGEGAGGQEVEDWAHGNTVRLAVASALLAAVDKKRDVRCRVDQRTTEIAVTIAGESGGLDMYDIEPEVLDALTEAGIRIQSTAGGVSLVFPRDGIVAHERA